MTISVAVEDGVTWARLDRPHVRNAINHDLLDRLHEVLEDAPPVLVLGSTSEAFSAGADLSLDDRVRASLSDRLYGLYERMRTTSTLIVACGNGPAVGGGAQLWVAADVRVGGPQSWVRFVGPGHGLVVGAWALATLVGRGRTLAWCLQGQRIEARQAHEAGLIDILDDDPEERARRLGAAVLELPGDVVVRLKHVVAESEDLAGLRAERRANADWSGLVGALDGKENRA